MAGGVKTRLSVMMFLEYLIWGSWLPLMSLYLQETLHFSGIQIGWIFATQAIASVTGTFVSGQLADRHFSTDRFLAVSHLIGGIAMFALGSQRSFWSFFVGMLVYMLVYIPTLSLTNSISFHHLKDAQQDFGKVRLWGTIGWIAASWPFVFILSGKTGAELLEARAAIFTVAGVASLALAAFSLALPKTPPSAGRQGNAPLEGIRLLRNPAVAVLFVVTFIDALVHQCYFFWTGPFLAHVKLPDNWIMPAMSIGQIAEIATMAALGYFLKRLGWRMTMTIGILGHVLRFFIYSIGSPVWLIVGSNVVHGFCYAFFFASVYIFVDEYFPKDARASAQSIFNLLILGIGPFLGNLLWGWLGDVYRTAEGIDFSRLFLVPSGLGLVAAVILFLGFHPPRPAGHAQGGPVS